MWRFLLRWSLRDLRSRWIQISVIALVVAFGTGMYAGLMSNADWAELSYDASYRATNMHDLRVSLTTGSLAEEGELVEALYQTGVERDVVAAEERLLVPIQVDASTGARTILVRGMLVGVPLGDGGPHINRLETMAGGSLSEADAGMPVSVLERNFGLFYQLPPEGEVLIGGGRRLAYVGQAVTPEYFVVQPPDGGFFSQAEFAAVFTSLETAQELSGFGSKVNDLLVTLSPGTDVARAAIRLQDDLGQRIPLAGVMVSTRGQDPTFRLLYDDLEGDRQFFAAFALLIFAGAVAGAFNLTSRMVEATRREFGISMALGLPRRLIAVRPLLMGGQIALLGVVFGVGIGRLVNTAMGSVLRDFLPLPEWRTPFIPDVYLTGAGIGFMVPFLAAALPVWRAVRVRPVEAIRTGHLAERRFGSAHLLRWVPGRSMAKIPFRNLVRAPRRTVLTAVGLGAAVTVLVGMIVMIDSFLATVDRGAAEVTASAPDRVVVGLDTIRTVSSPEVARILDADTVGRADLGLRVRGEIARNGVGFPVVLEVIDLQSSFWHPTIVAGDAQRAGLVLAEKAADDLGVEVGDSVTLTHPRREALTSFRLVRSELEVVAIHPHPFRFVTYLDDSAVGLLGGEGLANIMSVDPAPGVTFEEVQRQLFENRVVTSVQRAGGVADVIREFLQQFVGILRIAEVAAVGLTLLIAFNAAGVAMEERAREHATMMAFGVPPRRIMVLAAVESCALGVISTMLGALGGALFLRWSVRTNVETTMPDILLSYEVTATGVAAVVLLGVGVVTIAPLLHWRRLSAIDVPATLRVME